MPSCFSSTPRVNGLFAGDGELTSCCAAGIILNRRIAILAPMQPAAVANHTTHGTRRQTVFHLSLLTLAALTLSWPVLHGIPDFRTMASCTPHWTKPFAEQFWGGGAYPRRLKHKWWTWIRPVCYLSDALDYGVCANCSSGRKPRSAWLAPRWNQLCDRDDSFRLWAGLLLVARPPGPGRSTFSPQPSIC